MHVEPGLRVAVAVVRHRSAYCVRASDLGVGGWRCSCTPGPLRDGRRESVCMWILAYAWPSQLFGIAALTACAPRMAWGGWVRSLRAGFHSGFADVAELVRVSDDVDGADFRVFVEVQGED